MNSCVFASLSHWLIVSTHPLYRFICSVFRHHRLTQPCHPRLCAVAAASSPVHEPLHLPLDPPLDLELWGPSTPPLEQVCPALPPAPINSSSAS
eukprot:441022-Pelagomonas_calceolata.AAC.3